jgi:hypothetical protein
MTWRRVPTLEQMTPALLSIVFGPILLRAEVETLETMMNASKVCVVARFLIEHFEDIFPVQAIHTLH